MLSHLSKVPLYDSTMTACGLADNDISKTNVPFLAPDAPSNTDHKPEFDWEAALHIVCDNSSRTNSHQASWEASDNNIVNPNSTQGILVLVALSLLQSRMSFIQHRYHGGLLSC